MFKIAISLRFIDIINKSWQIYCIYFFKTQNYNFKNTNSDKHHTLLMHLFIKHQFPQKNQLYHNIEFIIYKHSFKNIDYWNLYLYERFSKNIL